MSKVFPKNNAWPLKYCIYKMGNWELADTAKMRNWKPAADVAKTNIKMKTYQSLKYECRYAKSQQQDCGGNIKNAPSGACRWLECSRKSATWTWVTKPPEILQNSNTASWLKTHF